jgi:glycosidase
MLTRKVKDQTRDTGRRIYQIGETYGSAELIGSYLGTGLLDAQFDFNLYDKAIVAFGKDDAGFKDLIQVAEEGLDQYGAHHLMGTITGNQDRPRFASLAEGTVRWEEDHKLAGWTRDIQREGIRGHQAMRMLTAFNMSMPGVPCIYQGDEYADVGGNDPDNRRMVRFDDLDVEEYRTRAMASEWIQLRRSRMSMLYGSTELKEVQPQLLRITRQYLGERTTVFINTSNAGLSLVGLEDVLPLVGMLDQGAIPPHTAMAFDGGL